MYAAFYEVVRLACCVFYHWHAQYKKRPARAHRATTQHFGNVLRMFVAKAQANGSNFTEMKNGRGKKGNSDLK